MSQQRELAAGAREATPDSATTRQQGLHRFPLTGRSAKCGIGRTRLPRGTWSVKVATAVGVRRRRETAAWRLA